MWKETKTKLQIKERKKEENEQEELKGDKSKKVSQTVMRKIKENEITLWQTKEIKGK